MRRIFLGPLTFLLTLGATGTGCGPVDTTEQDVVVAASGVGSVESIDDLMPRAAGDTHSSTTPMGIYFQSIATHVLTSSERAFLSDASKSPGVPPSTSGLHLQSFPVDLYPHGLPTPADVNQHAVGDCSAAAVLASMAMLASRFIQARIDDHGDGTFGVHVFDPSGHPLLVNVDSRFLAGGSNELEAMSGKNGSADWATVLEKAVMKYLAVFPIVSRIGGIGSEFMSPILTGTGDSFAFMPGSLSPAELARVVRVSLARGKLVIGGFNAVMPLGDVKTVTLHAYSILLPGASGAMLSMRNPWGASPLVSGGFDPSHDGVLNVPSGATWTRAIDLRIIAAGAATGAGVTTPYTPPDDVASASVRIRTE